MWMGGQPRAARGGRAAGALSCSVARQAGRVAMVACIAQDGRLRGQQRRSAALPGGVSVGELGPSCWWLVCCFALLLLSSGPVAVAHLGAHAPFCRAVCCAGAGVCRVVVCCCQVAADGIARCIGASYPGVPEQQLAALFEFVAKARGASRLSYPSVVAGGFGDVTRHASLFASPPFMCRVGTGCCEREQALAACRRTQPCRPCAMLCCAPCVCCAA